MGMRRDMKQRVSLARADDVKQHNLIRAAHEAIYLKNYAVDSNVVEKLLREESLVLTVVCVFPLSLAG